MGSWLRYKEEEGMGGEKTKPALLLDVGFAWVGRREEDSMRGDG